MAGPGAFTILCEEDDLVLSVRGLLDAASAPELRKRLRVMCDLTGNGRLIVDLREADHPAGSIDAAVLHALRAIAARCREHDIPLVLRHPAPAAERATA
jgi:anti-anti-sigma regulatory factor